MGRGPGLSGGRRAGVPAAVGGLAGVREGVEVTQRVTRGARVQALSLLPGHHPTSLLSKRWRPHLAGREDAAAAARGSCPPRAGDAGSCTLCPPGPPAPCSVACHQASAAPPAGRAGGPGRTACPRQAAFGPSCPPLSLRPRLPWAPGSSPPPFLFLLLTRLRVLLFPVLCHPLNVAIPPTPCPGLVPTRGARGS